MVDQHNAVSPGMEPPSVAVDLPIPADRPSKDHLRCHLALNKDRRLQGAWRLGAAIAICTAFMIAEVVGGIFAHSLAIITDAAHMLSDVSAFAITLFAGLYAMRKSQESHTFGYHRIEVLGSLVSILIIWVVTVVLMYEAVLRLINPVHVDGRLMFILAVIGLMVNLLVLLVFGHGHSHDHGHGHDHGHSHGHGHGHSHGPAQHNHEPHGDQVAPAVAACDHAHSHAADSPAPAPTAHGHGHGHGMSLGMRAALIHAVGDTVQSLGVIVAGALIWARPDWHIADPICTFLFGFLVLLTTRKVLRDIVDIIMERVPRNVNLDALSQGLLATTGVLEVHDLHVWCIKPGVVLMTAHIGIGQDADAHAVTNAVTAVGHAAGIEHSTVQLVVHGLVCACSVRDVDKLVSAA